MAVQPVTQKTYLELLRGAVLESGSQQAVPSSINDKDGLVPLFKKWINDEWVDLQNERWWEWRKETTEVVIATGMDKYDARTILGADAAVWMDTEHRQEFLLMRELDTSVDTPGDLAFTSSSGSQTTITGTATLPSVAAGEHFVIANANTDGNNGAYRATGTPTTSSITAIKVDGTPVDDGADAGTTFEHATGEDTQSDEDQFKVRFVPWNNWRGYNERLVERDPGRPRKFTVDQDGVLLFDYPTDKFYGLDFDYYEEVTEMTADADTPTNLPKEYQDILVWAAVEKYGEYEESPQVERRGVKKRIELKKRMDKKYLPEVRLVPYPLYGDYD